MICTTTPTIEGSPIKAYKGVVTGEEFIDTYSTIRADISTYIRGGHSDDYEETLVEARDTAMEKMQEQATDLGANAIVGISFTYETVGPSNIMFMVTVSGTAVVI